MYTIVNKIPLYSICLPEQRRVPTTVYIWVPFNIVSVLVLCVYMFANVSGFQNVQKKINKQKFSVLFVAACVPNRTTQEMHLKYLTFYVDGKFILFHV